MFLPHPIVKLSIVGSLRDREVACSASDRQSLNFESCAWRAVSSHSSHHSQEVLLARFGLYVHKGGLKPDSFHLICFQRKVRMNSALLTRWTHTVRIEPYNANVNDNIIIIVDISIIGFSLSVWFIHM